MLKLLPVVALLGAVANQAFAQDGHEELARATRVLNNVQHEMVTCAAYFGAVAVCMGNSGDAKGEAAYQGASERLIGMSTEVAMAIGLSAEAMAARAAMEGQQIKQQLNGNCINISVIMKKHMDRCTTVASNPDAIMSEYERKFSSDWRK